MKRLNIYIYTVLINLIEFIFVLLFPELNGISWLFYGLFYPLFILIAIVFFGFLFSKSISKSQSEIYMKYKDYRVMFGYSLMTIKIFKDKSINEILSPEEYLLLKRYKESVYSFPLIPVFIILQLFIQNHFGIL